MDQDSAPGRRWRGLTAIATKLPQPNVPEVGSQSTEDPKIRKELPWLSTQNKLRSNGIYRRNLGEQTVLLSSCCCAFARHGNREGLWFEQESTCTEMIFSNRKSVLLLLSHMKCDTLSEGGNDLPSYSRFARRLCLNSVCEDRPLNWMSTVWHLWMD